MGLFNKIKKLNIFLIHHSIFPLHKSNCIQIHTNPINVIS